MTSASMRRASPRKAWAAFAGVLVICLAAAAWPGGGGNLDGGSSEPAVIAGGNFEASGVAYVPGSNQLLFVDDGRTREIFVMELSADGSQKGAAVPVPLGANVTDLEGITSDGRYFYVVGSQSKTTGFDGDGLVRFTFDPASRRIGGVERIQGLKAWLAANVPELNGTERRIGDDVLNIEALAWDPAGQRLLLGLRAPVVDGQSLIVPVKLADPAAPFSRENLRVDGSTIRLQLGGAGIRSLEYDEPTGAFRIIVGASLNDETRDFRIVGWNGKPGSALPELVRFSRRLKPEGITRGTLDGRSVSVVVFDVGRFDIIE